MRIAASSLVGLACCVLMSGCGSSRPPQTATATEGRAAERSGTHAPLPAAVAVTVATVAPVDAQPEVRTVATTREVPETCDDAKNCFPPSSFTEAVCKKKFPDLPLLLFSGRMPWQHRYVKAEHVEPVNPHGGEQNEMWMKFGEEVVVLRRRAPAVGKGMQMSGPTDLDVLRWDGTCATIREEMLVSYVPAPMQSPRVIWKYLDSQLQEALLKHQVVARARENERKSCRDSSVTHPTPACEKAMQKLTDAIALAIRQNVELPRAGNVPEWQP